MSADSTPSSVPSTETRLHVRYGKSLACPSSRGSLLQQAPAAKRPARQPCQVVAREYDVVLCAPLLLDLPWGGDRARHNCLGISGSLKAYREAGAPSSGLLCILADLQAARSQVECCGIVNSAASKRVDDGPPVGDAFEGGAKAERRVCRRHKAVGGERRLQCCGSRGARGGGGLGDTFDTWFVLWEEAGTHIMYGPGP